MAESTKPRRRGARRSSRVSRQLAEARQRNAEQLAQRRQQEARVEDALAAYFDATEKIAAAEEHCRRRIEPHERAIARLREQRDQRVAAQEAAQGLAALTIHEADRTVEQVGKLLELGEKSARRLITVGRKATAKDKPAGDDCGTPQNGAVDVHQGSHVDDEREAEPPTPTGTVAGAGGDGWPAGAADSHDGPVATSGAGGV